MGTYRVSASGLRSSATFGRSWRVIDAFSLVSFVCLYVCFLNEPVRRKIVEFACHRNGKAGDGQVYAVLAVRPIGEIRVFGRDKNKCKQFAARVQEESGVKSVASETMKEAVSGVKIITTVTRATEPNLDGSMVAFGAHINAVGAIVPGRHELSRSVFDRASMIVTDSVTQARELSSEMIDFMGGEDARWERVIPLARLVQSERPRLERRRLPFLNLLVSVFRISLWQ